MADCEWRLARARYIETATIDLQVDDTAGLVEKRLKTVDEPVRVAFNLQLLDSGQSAAYKGVQRQESRLHRQYERSYKLLTDIRKSARIKNTSWNEPICLPVRLQAKAVITRNCSACGWFGVPPIQIIGKSSNALATPVQRSPLQFEWGFTLTHPIRGINRSRWMGTFHSSWLTAIPSLVPSS